MRPFLLLPLCLLLACDGGSDSNTKDTEVGSDFSDADGDGYATTVDCDDADATVNPGATETWYDGTDQDCDGADDDQDGDGFLSSVDCDDTNPAIYPDAGEVPDDGIDQDCDGEDLSGGSLEDADGDGFAASVDCDDTNPDIHPGAQEIWYDGIDQDCNGSDDDQDGDNYESEVDCDDTDAAVHPGAGEVPDDGTDQDCDGEDLISASEDDVDGDGFPAAVDCDDTDDTVYPGATEVWYDGTDQDCDGADDDQDGDGVLLATDCDDTDASVHPGAGEVPADGIDQDCDGADASYPSSDDADGDGYASWVDCDDGDTSVHPGAAEVWYDGNDQDCDGNDDDQDGDGYAHGTDCDDTDATIFPGAGDVPADGIDQDCNGSDAVYPSSDDADGDGYAATVDCDDGDPSVHIGATEIWYDGTDQDCDGSDDDQDGDGYGHASDCDDTDAGVYPDAIETADDGVDQDCDGSDMIGMSKVTAGKLIVTEIMNKPGVVGDQYGEWIELYNGTGKRLLLDGLVVTGTVNALSFTVSGDVQIPAGGYAVLVREGDTTINGDVEGDYDYRSDFALDNDAETLTLTYGATTIDTVAYDDQDFFPDTSGATMTLDGDYFTSTKNDNGQYWCDGSSTFGDGDLGTPGAENDACSGLNDTDGDGYVSAHDCDDTKSAIHPGATETARDSVDSDCDGADFAASGLRSGDIIVSEVMQNPDLVADADGEWFEVYNTTSYSINLTGLTASDAGTDTFTVDEDIILASHTYAVFAVNTDPLKNGGVDGADFDYPGSTFGLGNGTDQIDLYNGTTLIDTVAWDNGATFPDPNGASMMLKTTKLSSSNNDIGSNWCTSTSSIGGDVLNDLGTPGAANDPC